MHSPSVSVHADGIEACLTCYRICLETATGHCLERGGEHAERAHLKLLFDCADICALCAQFMIRNSPLHARLCELCTEVCKRCAQDCERFRDEHMTDCAEACRLCAASCQIELAPTDGVA